MSPDILSLNWFHLAIGWQKKTAAFQPEEVHSLLNIPQKELLNFPELSILKHQNSGQNILLTMSRVFGNWIAISLLQTPLTSLHF